jgi:hypothetical protein
MRIIQSRMSFHSRIHRVLKWKIISPDYRVLRPIYKLLDRANCRICPQLRRLERLEDRLEASRWASIRAARRPGYWLWFFVLMLFQFIAIGLWTYGLRRQLWGIPSPKWGFYLFILIIYIFYFATTYWFLHRYALRDLRREIFYQGADICPECEYDLRGINPPRCPECGASLDRPASRVTPAP